MIPNIDNRAPQKARLLGIDYGSKRVGVAVTDESCKFALPLSVVENTTDLAREIEKIAVDNEVREIVLGESRDYKNEPNQTLLDSMSFKDEMEKRGFVVYFEPEFMTSLQASRIQGDHKLLDASAAAIILQSYIDRNKV